MVTVFRAAYVLQHFDYGTQVVVEIDISIHVSVVVQSDSNNEW